MDRLQANPAFADRLGFVHSVVGSLQIRCGSARKRTIGDHPRAMRVMIDTTYARRACFSGTAVYIEQLCDQLRRHDDVELVEVANPRRRPPAGGGLGSVRNLVSDRWWLAVDLPRLARVAGVDVIHHPLPALARGASSAQVITVHDLSFERLPRQFGRGFRLYAQHTHRGAARTADAVICVSETTAADARQLWGIDPSRIVVARHGAGQLPPGAATEVTQREHFLYVGDDEPRKNLGTLLAAYRRYRERTESPLPLVLSGSATATEPGVRCESSPGRDRLAQLYGRAVALIQPSLYEGFGLTALEAMSVGTAVIAARSQGLVEVCGEAACYADPHDPSSFAAAMSQLAADSALRRELSLRGRRRAAEFSWLECARAHVAAYEAARARHRDALTLLPG
jgi:glycosyltransferase involved in cell wall biosynthesis